MAGHGGLGGLTMAARGCICPQLGPGAAIVPSSPPPRVGGLGAELPTPHTHTHKPARTSGCGHGAASGDGSAVTFYGRVRRAQTPGQAAQQLLSSAPPPPAARLAATCIPSASRPATVGVSYLPHTERADHSPRFQASGPASRRPDIHLAWQALPRGKGGCGLPLIAEQQPAKLAVGGGGRGFLPPPASHATSPGSFPEGNG